MSRARQRPLTFQVTVSVIALAAFTLVLVSAFGLYAVSRADHNALERQKIFMRSGLDEQAEALAREQESVTLWDDSVVNAKAGDQQWMSENLGEWLYSYYGHDQVYVLDDHDRPVHAMRDGKTLEPQAYDTEAATIAPLVRKLRERMATPPTDDGAEPPENRIADIVMLGDTPAMVAVMPLMPDSDRVEQAAGTEYVHVSVQLIDNALISRIAEHYLLEGAAFSLADTGTRAEIPLQNDAGDTLGFLTWQQDRPGVTLVRQAAPALVGAGALGCGLLVFLLRRLRRASRQLQTSQDEAQYLAFHDTLTGLPNRALFEDRLKRALVTVQRGRGRIALVCLDLDRFKHINDTLGHPAGDELVRQTAIRLGLAVREVDTVARLGGDEFAIVLVDIRNLRTAEDLCERLLEDIAVPFHILGDEVAISASIGIAISPDFGADPDELLRKADIALYEAKKAGRGRYQVFAGDMDDILLRRRLVESDLRATLEGGTGLDLAYQPVFSADTTTLAGAEATLAWDHPVHGTLPQAHLFGIAEERGMIGALCERMLRTACAFAAQTTVPWVAVPVSAHALRDQHCVENALSILIEYGIAPGRIQLDVAEGVFLEGATSTRSALQQLRKAGVGIAIDDFGSGASSLTALRRNPVDKLKIDRSFVRALGGADPSAAMVKALVTLADSLGMRVAAEGVETAEQRGLLRAMGCHELQGPLFSPPLTAGQFRELLERQSAQEAALSTGT